ncbi:MAG: amino acid adenylation domain-containing protein, partial [Pseudonocardiales bacterium]|nr:amino acid adenylation domain-containing protein [Pseudonocardiales bacterium]
MTALEGLSAGQRALLDRRLAKARISTSGVEVIPRLPHTVTPPMSFAQQRLWFLHQYDPEDPSYNIPVAFWLHGDVDLPALSAALGDLAATHDVLHTCYPSENGEPQPVRSPEMSPPLRQVDVASDIDLEALVAEDVRHPFDLAAELPIRATVYRRTAGQFLFLLELHHIAADGWSLSVLLDELGKRYDARRAGSAPPVAETTLRYGDVAAWQAQRLSGPRLERELGWWKNRLADLPPGLALPTDRPRPSVATTSGDRFDHVLQADLAELVRTGAGQEGCTPFMVCLAGLGIALGRICGTEVLAVGVPVAGRLTPELERVVGCFVNTLAMRVDVSGDPTGVDLLARVRGMTLDAYDHQELPFEKLVEHLAPQRDLSTSAVFQVMLNMHNQPLLDLRMTGVRTRWMDIGTATTKFDLHLAVVDTGGTMTVTFTYNSDLFEPPTVQRLAGAFEQVLTGLCADPTRPVSAIPLLTGSEREQLTNGRNDTAAAYPRGGTVHGLFEEQAARVPQAIAVTSGGQDCSYADLNDRANRLARRLIEAGIGPDSVVALFLEPSVEWVVAMLAALKAGAAYLPIDARYPTTRVEAMLADAGAAVVLTSAGLGYDRPAYNGTVPGLAVEALEVTQGSREHPATNPGVALPPTALAYLLFTSGSSGRPKAVAVQHDNLLNYLYGVRERAGLEPGWSYAQVSTLAADLGNTNVFGALTSGGRLHLLSYEQATDPDVLAGYFGRHRIDVMKLVPSHFEVLLGAAEPHEVVPHRRLILAGEPCRPELVRRASRLRPDTVVHNHYGPTEATVSMLGCDARPESGDAIPLGRPFGNVRCYVLDAVLEPMPDGMPGELYIGGAGVARGYHDRPGLTAERFLPDPYAGEPGSRMHRTGDRVRWRADGMLEFLGRVDAQLKIRGYRVEPGEIEAVLADQPEVAQGAVRGWGDGPDVRLAAYLVLQAGHAPEIVATIRDRLRAALPDHLVPSAFVELESLPLTGNGKVDRQALPAPTANAGSREYAEPGTDLEIELAGVFAEVLEVERVGLDDNFFDLGGESFKAVRAARRISQPVRVVEMFTRPTVRELAAHLETPPDKVGDADQLLHRLTPARSKVDVSLVCIPYGGGSAISYQHLADAIPEDTALWAAQLPGHDTSRADEAPAPLREVARRCADEVLRDIPGEVIVYGHCLGGALAVEVARLVEAAGGNVGGVVLAGTFPAARLPGRLFGALHRFFPADRWTSTRAYR